VNKVISYAIKNTGQVSERKFIDLAQLINMIITLIDVSQKIEGYHSLLLRF
jgi:hypothetical protein